MTHILDDANVVAQRDPQGALGFAAQQPEQLKHDFGIAGKKTFARPIYNVVFAGMGGSALAAEFARTWPSISEPFVVTKEYGLPNFVDEDTLVIVSSYSGNTEETLEALTHAEQKGAQIAVLAHGGKLLERAKAAGYLLVEIPEAPQPRTGVFYSYRGLVEILVAAGLVEDSAIGRLEALVEPLKQATSNWVQSVPAEQNYAKQIADQLTGKADRSCTPLPTNGKSVLTRTPKTPRGAILCPSKATMSLLAGAATRFRNLLPWLI
jgi:glucose/mannose-6-phosphate isomerase